MPGKPCIFKAFRASFTLMAAGYIAAADVVGRSYLPLGLGRVPFQAIAATDDIRLPLRQPFRHQTPQQRTVILVLQVLQQGIVPAYHIADRQISAIAVGLDGIAERYLPLQLTPRPKVHEDLILNASAGVGSKADTPVWFEGIHRFDQADGTDGDQILLFLCLGIVFFGRLKQKEKFSRSKTTP